MKLTDKVYGLLYRNHRYGENEYQLCVFESEAVHKVAIEDYRRKPGVEILVFEMALEDLPLVKLRGG